MQLTKEQYERIVPYLPVQRGNVRISNLQTLSALLYMAENGCKWRGLPAHFGRWHTIYTRMSRWAKSGILDQVFEKLKDRMDVPADAFSMDSTSIKVHPDGTGALKNGPQSIGRSSGGWNTKIHMLASSDRHAVKFALSPSQTRIVTFHKLIEFDAAGQKFCGCKRERQAVRHALIAENSLAKARGLWKSF